MTPINLPYLQIYASGGKRFAYYRRNGRRIRLRGEVGSPEFLAAYQIARQQVETTPTAPDRQQARVGSLAALVVLYKGSPEFLHLSAGSRARYASLLEPLLRRYADGRVASLHRSWVLARRDELASTPRTANYLVAVIRRLLSFAVDREWRTDNPASRIKPLRMGPGNRPWTDAEVKAFIGPAAGDLRLPVLLALHTAQRQGDILRLLWSAYDGSAIRLRQSKTGTEVVIPAHPDLRAVLAETPRTAAVICVTGKEQPWKIDWFKHRFAQVRASLGLPDDLHFHGLRHSAAMRLAEAGCSDAEIQAITGHKTRAMVARYTAGARQESLARAAIARLPRGRNENA